MVSLDGGNRVVGTEFIKLLNTGSSDLATVQYVDDAIAQGGGGGGGNVDLSNYYTQTEVDNLLNNKLNTNNPQDITGTLRIDSTNGNGKLIVNAVGAPNDEDFYVNGLSNLGGTLKAQLIQASSNIQTSQQIQSNTINTYSNSNMIIQRNAIPYITLDSQIIDDETVEKIILMKDVEFSGGLSLNTLSVDTLNTNGLNDMVFNVATLGEFLRFQVSDNTVRVPNTRSFLSQDIYLDNIRPLTFSNDVVFNGGNSTNDAYEEYIRLDASTEKVNVSKIIDANENVIMKPNRFLYFDETSKVRYIRSSARSSPSVQNHLDIINEDGSQGRIRLLIGSNGSNTTDEQFLVDNTIISCKRNLRAGAGLETNTIDTIGSANLSFQRGGTEYLRFDTTDDNIVCSKEIVGGGGMKCNTFDSDGSSNVIFKRDDINYITFNSDRININQALHLSNTLFIDTVNKLSLRPSLEGSVNIFDIRNLHPIADNPMIRFRVGEGGGETIVCEMTENAVSLQRNVIVGTAYELRTNTIDTTNDNDLVFNRNNVPFLTLDKFTEDTIEKEAIVCSKQLRANSNMLVRNFQINQISVGIEYTDFRLENASNSIMRFYVGNSTSVNLQISQTATLNEILLNRTTKCNGTFHTNAIDTFTDTDLLIKRNDTEVLRIRASDNLILTSDTTYFSSPKVYANEYLNRTSTYDTVFYGANSTSDGRVEYMKWNRANQSLDFNAPIDNTNIAVIGNIVDTTVSDERLKINVQDVESNYCNCIKNVKIKTFEYKDEKYKDSDKYGFIAQHLQKHLPKEFDNIVKETKPKKEEGEAYLSINYMKLSVVLWGALQETLNKVEHLEASMYEMMEDIKELKGKKTTKPKAKAKSKAKSKN